MGGEKKKRGLFVGEALVGRKARDYLDKEVYGKVHRR